MKRLCWTVFSLLAGLSALFAPFYWFVLVGYAFLLRQLWPSSVGPLVVGGMLIAVPVLWIILAAMSHRKIAARLAARRAGRCAACGYDLRATPERCPECGRARNNVAA